MSLGEVFCDGGSKLLAKMQYSVAILLSGIFGAKTDVFSGNDLVFKFCIALMKALNFVSKTMFPVL